MTGLSRFFLLSSSWSYQNIFESVCCNFIDVCYIIYPVILLRTSKTCFECSWNIFFLCDFKYWWCHILIPKYVPICENVFLLLTQKEGDFYLYVFGIVVPKWIDWSQRHPCHSLIGMVLTMMNICSHVWRSSASFSQLVQWT